MFFSSMWSSLSDPYLYPFLILIIKIMRCLVLLSWDLRMLRFINCHVLQLDVIVPNWSIPLSVPDTDYQDHNMFGALVLGSPSVAIYQLSWSSARCDRSYPIHASIRSWYWLSRSFKYFFVINITLNLWQSVFQYLFMFITNVSVFMINAISVF